MRHEHILRYIASDVWLMDDARLDAIIEVVKNGPLLAEFPKVEQQPTESPQGIAIIPVVGTIAPKMNMMTALSGGTTAEGIENAVLATERDDSIAVRIMEMDSPGGFVEGVEEAAAVIRESAKVKPIIGVINHQASSAMYWMGSAVSELFASPSARGGSIGVASVHTWKDEANSEVKHEILKIGERKAQEHPYGPLTDEARASIMDRMQEVYGRFVGAVAEHRQTTTQNVMENFGKGGTLSAQQMAEVGMIDGLKTMRQVVSEQLSNLSRKQKYRSYLDSPRQRA